MTVPDLDRETTRAVEALARRIREMEPGTDPDLFAREYLLALRGQGWRPTNAAPPGPWKTGPGLPTSPETQAAVDSLKAQLRATGGQPVLRETGAA